MRITPIANFPATATHRHVLLSALPELAIQARCTQPYSLALSTACLGYPETCPTTSDHQYNSWIRFGCWYVYIRTRFQKPVLMLLGCASALQSKAMYIPGNRAALCAPASAIFCTGAVRACASSTLFTMPAMVVLPPAALHSTLMTPAATVPLAAAQRTRPLHMSRKRMSRAVRHHSSPCSPSLPARYCTKGRL